MAAILQLSQYCTFRTDSISTVITEPGQPGSPRARRASWQSPRPACFPACFPAGRPRRLPGPKRGKAPPEGAEQKARPGTASDW